MSPRDMYRLLISHESPGKFSHDVLEWLLQNTKDPRRPLQVLQKHEDKFVLNSESLTRARLRQYDNSKPAYLAEGNGREIYIYIY